MWCYRFIFCLLQAFFTQERVMLEKKRNKMRMVQQRKISDLSSCIELPKEIPLQLVIGSKVTARLRKPQDGLFTGSIDAVDTSNNTYRITFERPGLGTHSIPDYEVLVRKLKVFAVSHVYYPINQEQLSYDKSWGKKILR